MSIPISGVIVMAFAGWFFITRPDDLILLALVLNAFAAAAVVNLGGGFPIGIAPYYFVSALLMVRVLPRWISGKLHFFAAEPVVSFMRALALFVVVCAISAFLLPRLFDGLSVDVPRAGVPSKHQPPLLPLHWSLSNAGQAIYLVLNFFVMLDFLRRSSEGRFSTMLMRAFSLSGVLASAVGLLQVLCVHLNLAFPAWIFNSNAAWAQNSHQLLAGGYRRMSASFVEPSMAGGFFASWTVFELTLAISSRRPLSHWSLAVIATVMLLLTTSSTGYLIAIVSWSFAALQTSLALLARGVVRARKLVAIVTAVGGAALILLLIPGVRELLNDVLLQKQSTESAIDRGATLGRALNVAFSTWGLGAGLGSNRAMSVFFYVLSNVGLVGTILFSYLIFKPYLIAHALLRCPDVPLELRTFIAAAGAAFAANMVGMIVSGAEITGSQFWVLLGMLLAGTRSAWLMQHGSLDAHTEPLSRLHQCSLQTEMSIDRAFSAQRS